MPECYIIMGENNTKKSSTVRALTGARVRAVYDVSTRNNGQIKIFVQISALQEADIPPNKFIEIINAEKCDYILTSLRINETGGHPKGYEYIKQFLNEGWNIVSVVILNKKQVPKGYPRGAPRPILIKNTGIELANSIPANKIGSILRKRWKWY